MKELSTIVDTLKIRTEKENIKYEGLTEDSFEYIKSVTTNEKRQDMTVGLSLNRRRARYCRIESLEEFKEEFKQMCNDFKIEVVENVKLNRIDIAIDSEILFEENLTYLNFMFELLTFQLKGSCIDVIDREKMKLNTFKKKNSKREVVFYDKREESASKHLFNTRLEFRFLNIESLDFEKHINKVIEMIEKMHTNLKNVEKSVFIRLNKKYRESKEKNKTTNLTAFVRNNQEYVFTDNILRMLYEAEKFKGNYVEWKKKVKKGSSRFKLFKEKDIEDFKKKCIRSLKKYMDD
jgi:hypothetical protein